MTVRELILLLKEFPPDLQVRIPSDWCSADDPVDGADFSDGARYGKPPHLLLRS